MDPKAILAIFTVLGAGVKCARELAQQLVSPATAATTSIVQENLKKRRV
jgi:hypothetical protein